MLLVKNWDKVVGAIKSAWAWLSSVPIFGPVIRGIETFIKVIGGLVGAWKSVVSWFSNFSLAGAGKAIVKSLADGIISAKDYVVDKIKSIAGSIRRFFGFSATPRRGHYPISQHPVGPHWTHLAGVSVRQARS